MNLLIAEGKRCRGSYEGVCAATSILKLSEFKSPRNIYIFRTNYSSTKWYKRRNRNKR